MSENIQQPETKPEDLDTKPTQDESAKTLRDRFEAKLAQEAKEKAELKAKLEAIEKAEEDKKKTLEEKLAEREKELQQRDKAIETFQKKSEIEKLLLKENVNTEFLDLINVKALGMVEEGVEVSSIIQNIKNQYPTAFIVENPRASNVGSSVTSSNSAGTITKEKALEMVANPELYRKHREEIIKALGS